MGIVVGSVADGDGAQGLTMVLYLVLAALGGLWMPEQILPAPLQTVAKALPSYHLAQLGWHVAQGVAPAPATGWSCSHGLPARRWSRSRHRAGFRCGPRELALAS